MREQRRMCPGIIDALRGQISKGKQSAQLINYSCNIISTIKQKDCNGDGVVDCDDFVKIHRFGPTGCNTTYDVDNYLRRYGTCRFQSLFTGWSSIAVRPLASGALAPPQSFLPSYKSFSTIRYSRTTTTTRPTTRWTTRPTVRTTTPRPTTWPTRTTTVRPTTRTTTTRSTTTRPTTRTTTTRPTTRTTTRTTTRAITTKSMTRIAVANIVNERKYVIEYLPRIQVNSSVTKTRITSSSRGWNNGTNGLVAWSSNCDFHDHICLGVKQSLPEQCGGFCAADPNCKLFVAHSCLCLMLTPKNSRSAITSKQGTICGYVKSRYSP